MGGLFGAQPQTTNVNMTNTTQFNPNPSAIGINWPWNYGTAGGIANYLVNNYYPGQLAAGVQPLSEQYWGQAGSQLGQNVSDLASKMQNLEAPAAYNLQADPNSIQFQNYNSGSFAPDQGTLNGIAAWGRNLFGQTPQVQAAPGVSGQASSYYVQPNQVSAPGGVGMIGGLQSVQAPNLTHYQMGPAQQTATQSFTAPGTAQQYMSPYTQQVVNTQLAQAQVQEQQQLQQQAAAATQAGAFGGSRQGVEAANTSIGYQQLAANLQAQGLQNAFNNAQQQFNQEQGLGLQSQTANQQAGLTVGGQNLAANLQTQGLGAQLGMQGQLANQQVGLQSALANQQAQEFGAQQNMQAQLANQQAGIQTGLAAQQMGLQGGMFNAQQANQMSLANQAAIMQGLGMQYQGGLQGALQQQQLGLQGQIQGAQLGLQSQQAQAAAQNALRQFNLGAIGQTAALQGQGLQTQLQGLGALGTAAQTQQGYAQSVADANLQGWLMQQELPLQALGAVAQMYAMGYPAMPTTTTSHQQGTYQTTGGGPSIFSQLLGGVTGALSGIGGLFGAKGGSVPGDLERKPLPTGLSSVPKYRDTRFRSKGTYQKGLGHFHKAA